MNRERIGSINTEEEKIIRQNHIRQRLYSLFPKEKELIKNGHFVDFVLFQGEGAFTHSPIFYIAGDNNFLSRCTALKIENNLAFIRAEFYSLHNLNYKSILLLEPELSVMKNTIMYLDTNPRYSFNVYIEALFMYPAKRDNRKTP